jgi:hypothetical protein
MEWVIVLVLLAGVLVVGAAFRRPPSTAPRTPRASTSHGDEGLGEIDHLFASALREHDHHRAALMEVRLAPLARRRVPVRAVRSSPSPSAARLCFANGTIVLAECRHRGELLNLAVGMQAHSVCLESWSAQPGGMTLRFTWANDRSAELWAVGLDQPD